MKKLLLFAGLLSSLGLFSQHPLSDNLNAIRPGDELVKQQVEYKSLGRAGENVIWNFGKLKPIDNEYKVHYQLPSLISDSILVMGKDSIYLSELRNTLPVVGIEHDTHYYYRYRNDSLTLLGYQNPTVLLHCSPPMLLAKYPVQYKQKTVSKYTAKGMYCERMPMFITGDNTLEADAYGIIILPSGDTVRHVLRTKNIQNITEWNKK